MASNIDKDFPAPLWVQWKGKAVAMCERHAKITMGLNGLAGKFTYIDVNQETKEQCEDCHSEEAKRQVNEQEKSYDKPKRRK